MISDIRTALHSGMPYLAECGGFMYLHDELEDMDGNNWPMIGWIHGRVSRMKKLQRFGYIELTGKEKQILGDAGVSCKAHEFHYYESSSNGSSFAAQKPLVKRNWECIHANNQGSAGFPHLYYYSNPDMIFNFLQNCEKRKTEE
jgi:cobyrinic acid a,c-diamide synthase